MPVTLTAVTPTPVTADDVRMYMRDYAPNNILLDQVQFGHEEITKAISYMTDEWNRIPPLSNDDIEVIPKSMVTIGAAAWLMQSEAFLQLRNQASYQDGSVQGIGVDDKHMLYLQFSRALKEEWKNSAMEWKKARNVAAGFGSVGSGYRFTGTRYTR